MPKKTLTPEQREAKNARDRARYHARREAGLTSDEARLAVPKLLERRPDLKESEDFVSKLGRGILGALDKVGEAITGKTSELARDSGAMSGTSPVTSRRPRSAKRETTPGAATRQSFADFVEANPTLGKNAAIRQYRASGGKIGNDRANDIWRDVTGAKLNPKKVTKISYIPNSKVNLFKEQRKYVKDARYFYVMQFEVGNTEYHRTEWVTITSGVELTFQTLVEETESLWDDGDAEGRYDPLEIIEGSIELVYAVDMEK